MYIRIALVTLLLLGVGCTRTSPSSGAGSRLGDGPTAVDSAGGTPLGMPKARNRSFANLPDRGDLVAYPARRVVKHDGAYTWHRAGLSEDHALSAVGGVMKITTPAGESLQFQYERHVEHPSGDWTWVGRSKGGAASDEVILTFGEKAAFGSISQPGKAPLKLTMSGGVSWLIETDPTKIAGIDNSATRPRKPDFLIPPKFGAGAGASMESAPITALASTSESAQAAAATTVDVLLGYTGGFAAAQGGQSQAVTRLNNMVEIANQAYANSQVDARIRMVHAMQVSYPDNTANDSALEALTGFRAPSTRTTPDAAFSALRAAREQYGADLVSLVRQFNTPENDGCGIAWMIGGGQTGIDNSDEYFGYSVVSDGRDAGTDGKTYFCREETLAHELGHNMGSQHDRVSATDNGQLKYGAFPYSFGYKSGSANGNFYTVMAYGDTGQTSFRIFSNPRTTYCGLPCGVAEQADNARSLTQLIPLISQFRSATVSEIPSEVDVRALGDVTADGRSDITWHNRTTGQVYYWAMNGGAIAGGGGMYLAQGYLPLAVGDFSGDGRADVMVSNGSDLRVVFAATSGGFHAPVVVTGYPEGWILAGAADVNADGRADVVWHNRGTGQLYYWAMNGSQIVGGGGTQIVLGYSLRAIADFNGDGRADVLVSNGGELRLVASSSSGGFLAATPIAGYPAGWSLAGAGDVTADGRADLIWHHRTTGELFYWAMNGSAIIGGRGNVYLPPGYISRAVGDLNADGRADLVISNGGDLRLVPAGNSGDFGVPVVITGYPDGWTIF